MKSRFYYFFYMLVWCAAFTLIGSLCASLVSVVPADNMTVNKLIRLGRKLSDAKEHMKVSPTTIEELTAKGICRKEDCLDAWGVPFRIKACERGTFYISSQGEPRIKKLFSHVKVSITGVISFDREIK